MGNSIGIWQLNGRSAAGLKSIDLQPLPRSLDEGTRQLPGGGYTTFRTFGRGRVMGIDRHFERLEESARLAGVPLQLDRTRILRALGQVLFSVPDADSRVRIIVDLEQAPGTVYILTEPLRVPSQDDYQNGVRVVTRPMQRTNPKAKLTSFIHTAASVRERLPKGINEAVMVSEDGRMLEGLSSNFFGVMDGVIWTAEDRVLSGITRALVLDVIAELGIPLRREGFPISEVLALDEAFLTSASRAVLPVTEIDGRIVGDGTPGPVARALLDGYLQRVEAQLEQL